MATRSNKKGLSARDSAAKKPSTPAPTLNAISVAGYKSLAKKQRIDIRPLTILAGANSGGKSSIMQPILLIKQTLDASFDPGSILLDGPNVKLTSAAQLLSSASGSAQSKEFSVGIETNNINTELNFRHITNKGLEIANNIVSIGNSKLLISKEVDPEVLKNSLKNFSSDFRDDLITKGSIEVVRNRSFLNIELTMNFDDRKLKIPLFRTADDVTRVINNLIHVPGLRGNPERDYKTTAVGDTFPGTFEVYVASIIKHWQSTKDQRLVELGVHLEELGLTWKVEAKKRDETQVELKVGRLPHAKKGGAKDLVSIADVGFGVSQTLPVLVALLTAKPGQIVYIEQPEIHLHPSAQRALANVISAAAKRNVIVIIETHSALLLRGIQTMVATDKLQKELVKLHWFRRDNSGVTTVSSADLDENGAFGDWPEDFDEVMLESENQYLSAAEAKLLKK